MNAIKRWLIRLWNPSFGLGELPHQPPPEAAAVIRKLIQPGKQTETKRRE